METVATIIPQIAPWVGDSGVCDNSPKALAALNQARLLLWEKGDFENTCEYVCFCCVDCCVTMPSRYRQIRTAWSNRRPLDLRGELYQAAVGLASCCGNQCGDYRTITEVGGYHPTFRDYDGEFYIAIAAEDALDTGIQLSFETLDSAQKRGSVTLTVGDPFIKVQSINAVTEILRAVKPKTKSRIRVYAIDTTTGEACIIAIYENSDINPSYKKYKMPVQCGTQLIALCKLKYFDLTDENELVEFNLNTLIPALQAVNARRNRDNAGFIDSLNIAVLEANKSTGDGEVKTITPMKIGGSRRPHGLISGNPGFYWPQGSYRP